MLTAVRARLASGLGLQVGRKRNFLTGSVKRAVKLGHAVVHELHGPWPWFIHEAWWTCTCTLSFQSYMGLRRPCHAQAYILQAFPALCAIARPPLAHQAVLLMANAAAIRKYKHQSQSRSSRREPPILLVLWLRSCYARLVKSITESQTPSAKLGFLLRQGR